MVSRAERSLVGDWWWTVDRLLLAALGALMIAGLVFLMAGGPPVAEKLGLSTFHFVNRDALGNPRLEPSASSDANGTIGNGGERRET